VNKHFNDYISTHLCLSQKDISQSIKSREWLINAVIKKIDEQEKSPKLYSENGKRYIPFGSYFKGTKVSDVDEFDIMLIIDSNTGVYSKSGTKFGEGIGFTNPNHKYDEKFKKSDGSGVSPLKQLNWLKDIIDSVLEPYGCDPSERDGQAITAYIKSRDLKIDFVPGGIFKKTDYPNNVFYIIPSGSNNNWIETNPRIDKAIIAGIAKDNPQFKNSIRLFKHIFKDSYNIRIGSYAVESAHVDCYSKRYFKNDFKYDFPLILDHIRTCVQLGKIPDMRDPSINLLDTSLSMDNMISRIDKISSIYHELNESSATLKADIFAMLSNS